MTKIWADSITSLAIKWIQKWLSLKPFFILNSSHNSQKTFLQLWPQYRVAEIFHEIVWLSDQEEIKKDIDYAFEPTHLKI